MIKPYEKIRQDLLKTIPKDKVRLIVSSCFTTTPTLENYYYDYLKTNPKYFKIYKHWVLSQNPTLLLNDSDLYQLRQAALGLPNIISSGVKMNLNKPLFFLLMDIVNPFLDKIITDTYKYYQITNGQKKTSTAKFLALQESLILWDEKSVNQAGYPNLTLAIIETFQAWFAKYIETPTTNFPENDNEFKIQFENEWQRIIAYSDDLSGFTVMPIFAPADIFRYLRLPFNNRKFRHLSKQKHYQEVMNYVAAIATFKPMPDNRIKTYYRQELCKLFSPLIMARIQKITKKGQFVLHNNTENLYTELENQLQETAKDFDFFYATNKNLQRNKEYSFKNLVFPLQGQLAKIGPITANDQYPFTAYIARKFEQKIKSYFSDDPTSEFLSLDEIQEKEFEKSDPMINYIANKHLDTAEYIPDYDAKDANGKIIGWKINTFANIINRGADSLRRWEKQGLIKPIRYEIYSPLQCKKIHYRAYTRDHIKQARGIIDLMLKKKRHQT